jgi:hypothetical protein
MKRDTDPFLKEPGFITWGVMGALAIVGIWSAFQMFPNWFVAFPLALGAAGGFLEGKGPDGVRPTFSERIVASSCGVILFGLLLGFAALLGWLGVGPFEYEML